MTRRPEGPAADAEAASADGRNRRDELLRVSARLFRERGFDGTTIRDIADAAGMRSGSPFYHFKTKQDILAAVMEEGLVGCLAALEDISAAELAPRDKFRALVRAQLETVLAEGHDFIPVLLYDWRALGAAHQQRIIALTDRYDQLWQQAVCEMKAAGLLRTDSRVARLLILGAINYAVQWYRPGGGVTLDQLADETLLMFLHDLT
ncbi:MAG: TetR/AcrR family transcriptional regulator [Telluria sp.]